MTDERFSKRLVIDKWLSEVATGEMSYTELAERILRLETFSGQACHVDTDRARRCGFGEVIFGSGKSPELITSIAQQLLEAGQLEVLVTRVTPDVASRVASHFAHARYDLLGRTLRLAKQQIARSPASSSPAARSSISSSTGSTSFAPPQVAVVCAGSTDLPVAREALETLAWMRITASSIVDVGVAGPYRLLGHLDALRQVAALVVVAGMEGALASVVGGLVACPVIAVPTSVGYGANLQGVTTLLSMLSSCAAGVTVVNIDAGFKGGYVAGLIARQCLVHAQPQTFATSVHASTVNR